MRNFDDELKRALQREEPSPGFAARVLARIESQDSPTEPPLNWAERLRTWFIPASLRWVAAGAVAVLLITFGAVQYRDYRRTQAEGQLAKEQVKYALQIASAKLNLARERVHQRSQRGQKSGASEDREKQE